MSHCERFETSLSVMIDGELGAAERLPVVDHLARCAACRRFYRDARALDALVLETASAVPVEAPSRDVWERIEAAGGLRPAARSGSVVSLDLRWKIWGAVAAAALLVAVGLSVVSLWSVRRVQPVAGSSVAVVLGRASGRMSDERFVELATELLRADPSYHDRMREVMNLVTRPSGGREGTPERRSHEKRRRGESPGAAGEASIETAMLQGRS